MPPIKMLVGLCHISFFLQLAAASSLKPPVVPLIVRSPYLSAWLPDARNAPWKRWPMFWTGQDVGLSVMVSIPESHTIYPLIGRPQDFISLSSEYKISEPADYNISFDASTTNLTYHLEQSSLHDSPTKIILSFLSPITPSSTFRQSLPASYFSVSVEGRKQVNIYSDVNGQWMSGDFENTIIWELHEPLHASQNWTSKSWQIARETQQVFTEIDDRSEWGNLYFTGPASASHQAGSAAEVRQEFAQRGRLSGEISRNFRSIKENEPVFAFSVSLDPSVGSRDAFVCFSIALVQDPVVQFAAARGLTLMRPFWASFFSDPLEMVRFHYADFPTTSVLAANFSRQLSADARKLDASGYEDLVSLSARQVLGAIQFSGTPQNPILFIKEISSNGNFQTVDVIFPAFPFFLYTNPRWLVYLLEPLIEHQLSGQYPNNYSMHDLGTHFPNATGHGDGQDEYMPLEECGDMLIMCLVAANAMRFVPQQPWTNIESGPRVVSIDGDRHSTTKETGLTIDSYGMDAPLAHSGHSAAYSWARRSYSLWKQWADYLVAESLIPQNQLSSDDFAGWLANQTNLALKGIVAIRAMSELSNFVGEKSDGEEYRMVAETYIRRWEKLGISRDRTHAKLAYGWYGSWTTLYNLFADALLCPHSPDYFHNGQSGQEKDRSGQHNGQLVSDEIYTMQSKWYHAVVQKYGLPLDSRHLYAKSDWEVFAAAVSSKKTRTIILESIARWVNETVTDLPLTDLYDTEGSGDFSPVKFMARPVVGGHFAPLALERACQGKAYARLRFLDQDTEAIDAEVTLVANEGGLQASEDDSLMEL